MSKILVIVEGKSEQDFINGLLMPHLASFGKNVSARLIGNPKHKGGNTCQERFLRDFHNLICQTKDNFYISTMFDYYGIDTHWFGKDKLSNNLNIYEKARLIEQEMKGYITQKYNQYNIDKIFIPYISMHELEGLFFSEPQVLSSIIGCDEKDIKEILSHFDTPEHINDSPNTAPSKRLIRLCPKYGKRTVASSIANSTTVEIIRSQCRHFDNWLTILENL